MVSDNATLPIISSARRREREREIWVGIFIILGLGALLVVLFATTNPSMFRGRYTITTIVPNAGGVRKGDPVQLRGVAVGLVRSFEIAKEGVAIHMEIEGEFPVPEGSRVEIAQNSLLGGSVANIIPGEGPPLRRGAHIPGKLEDGLFARVDQVAGDAQQALDSVQRLLSEQTTQNVEASSAQLARLLAEINTIVAEQRDSIGVVSQSLRHSAQSVEQVAAGPELKNIMQRLDVLSQRMDAVAVTLNQSAASAQQVIGRVEQGQGSLGRLSKDDALYMNANRAAANIGEAAAELSKLAQDVRKNPKRYINLSVF